MTKENIKAVFEDYLLLEQTQHALLINGAWGSGKTYFWKKELAPIAETRNFKPIYVSLNGLGKIEQLEHTLFIRLIPFLRSKENKTFKATTTLFTNVANIFSQHYFKAGLAEIFRGVSIDALNLSSYVIVLDDLERCQIPIKEVLGYINNYIEHKQVKMLILADETNIDTKQQGYNTIKEKAIGRVLNFELDTADIVPTLFRNYAKDEAFERFLGAERDFIIGILKEFKQPNLRVIAFYLDILKVIYLYLQDHESQYVREVILLAALISFEFKSGNLTSADCHSYKGLPDAASVFFINLVKNEDKQTLTEKTKTYTEAFGDKYLQNRSGEFHFYPSIYSYILSGYFDNEQFIEELRLRKPEQSEEQEALRDLTRHSFRALENDVFASLVENVKRYASQGKYTIYEYAYIGNFFLFFSSKHLIELSKEGVQAFIYEGLNIAKARKEIDEYSLDNLLHFDSENPDTEKIKQDIKKMHQEIQKEKHRERSQSMIDAIKNNNVEALKSLFEKHQFERELIALLDPKLLFDVIDDASNLTVYELNKLINSRYKISNIGEFLADEIPTLQALADDLEKYIGGSPLGQPRALVFNDLLVSIVKQCEHLENTRKK